MSALINWSEAPRTVHVLIVGVGMHARGRPASLIGMGSAVRRSFEWWRSNGANRCVDGWSLGSLEALASDRDGVSLTGLNGEAMVPDAPDLDAVIAALEGWGRRARRGGMGFLFWSGHGAVVGQGGDAPLLGLLCQDETEDGETRALHWPRTLVGLNGFCGDSRISCFIDTCRTPARTPYSCRTALEGSMHLPASNPAFVQYTTVEGSTTYSHPHPITAVDFEGGPIGTHAVFDALDRYGVLRRSRQYGATAFRISEALRPRMERIGAHIPGLGSHWEAEPPGSMPSWAREWLVKIPKPMSMIDVVTPNGEDAAGFVCSVTLRETAEALAQRPGRGRFEVSMPCGPEHEVKLVEKPEPPGNVIYEEPFTACQPHEQIETERGQP